jgi:anti-anti-sigma regulatory factor
MNLNDSEREESRETELPVMPHSENLPSVQAASERTAGIVVTCSGESSALRLAGPVNIASAAELKAALLKSLQVGRPVSVSIEDITDLDVTTLQLLWAGKRHAASHKLAFTIGGGASPAVESLMAELGMGEAGLSA